MPDTFTCPLCKRVSHYPDDVLNSYCGCCGGAGMEKTCEHRPTGIGILDAIKLALIRKGWLLDPAAVPNASDELRELIHPVTDERMAWLDAVLAQMALEDLQEAAERAGATR